MVSFYAVTGSSLVFIALRRRCRYTWLFCQKFDVENKNSPALPFDEANVGAFIEEKSKEEKLSKSGLAHLKPKPQAAGRIPQHRGPKAATPIWARRPETTTKLPLKAPPRRGLPPNGVPLAPMNGVPMQRMSAAPGSGLRIGTSTSGSNLHPGAQPSRATEIPPLIQRPPPMSGAQSLTVQNATYYRNGMTHSFSPLMAGAPPTPVGYAPFATANTPVPMTNTAQRSLPVYNPNALYHAQVPPPALQHAVTATAPTDDRSIS